MELFLENRSSITACGNLISDILQSHVLYFVLNLKTTRNTYDSICFMSLCVGQALRPLFFYKALKMAAKKP